LYQSTVIDWAMRSARSGPVAASASTMLKSALAFKSAPKDFRQYHVKDGRKVWNLTGIRRVLYRLPRVIEAVQRGETVWVAEGEKDVHALEEAGAVATCNPMGAGKWRPEYADVLDGASVIVVADRDEAGRKHGAKVAASLDHKALVVTMVEAAEGKDAADHLAAGLGLDDFRPVEDPVEPQPPAEDQPKQTQAAVLVRLARERYHLIIGDDGRPYAVAKDGPAIARPLRGRGGLREQLARIYSDTCRGAVASAAAFTDAIAVLEGHASQADPVPVYLRVAPHGDGIVLDLGTPDGRCIVATPAGWRRERRSPVLFRRTALTMALPDPVRPAPGAAVLEIGDDGKPAGMLAPLAALLNTSETTFRLLIGWLLAALIPGIPHPVLALLGEQGTAKSTTARLLAGLIDPSPAPLRSPPRDIRQWAITAAAGWTVCIDNISSIPDWLSDSLCKAVTGDGIVDRALYTDDDVIVLAFRRVITLTSIDAGELRGDLGDRLLPAELDRIADTDRRADAAIAADYEAGRPELLGAILTLLCECLARLPAVELEAMPRMADFGRVLAALDQVTGWDTLGSYRASADDIAEVVVESDLFAEAIRELVTGQDSGVGTWKGTAAELRQQITPAKPPKWWPRTPRAASGRLRRSAPSLRRVGVEVTFTRDGHARHVTIACADMKCERPSHRHYRHNQDGDQSADQQEFPDPGCDGSDGTQPSHPHPEPTQAESPTVTPSQRPDQQKHAPGGASVVTSVLL
jgi:5S rRNA maturation endonuclease (ribonuclease M5)